MENDWQIGVKTVQAKHSHLVDERQAAHRKRLQDAKHTLHEVINKRDIGIPQIDAMRKQIMAERDQSLQIARKIERQ
jgi:hypothetical protein